MNFDEFDVFDKYLLPRVVFFDQIISYFSSKKPPILMIRGLLAPDINERVLWPTRCNQKEPGEPRVTAVTPCVPASPWLCSGVPGGAWYPGNGVVGVRVRVWPLSGYDHCPGPIDTRGRSIPVADQYPWPIKSRKFMKIHENHENYQFCVIERTVLISSDISDWLASRFGNEWVKTSKPWQKCSWSKQSKTVISYQVS